MPAHESSTYTLILTSSSTYTLILTSSSTYTLILTSSSTYTLILTSSSELTALWLRPNSVASEPSGRRRKDHSSLSLMHSYTHTHTYIHTYTYTHTHTHTHTHLCGMSLTPESRDPLTTLAMFKLVSRWKKGALFMGSWSKITTLFFARVMAVFLLNKRTGREGGGGGGGEGGGGKMMKARERRHSLAKMLRMLEMIA